MHSVIVVGIDGSACGYAAVAEASELATLFGATLFGLSVEEGLPRFPSLMDNVDDYIQKRNRYFTQVGVKARRVAVEHGAKLSHEVRVGVAADRIVRFIDEVGADLVVLGYKGHRFARFVIGTTAVKVNARSKASVLIVKPMEGPKAVWGRTLRVEGPI
jgi:nucleotide-binding universal stress UspA family protein